MGKDWCHTYFYIYFLLQPSNNWMLQWTVWKQHGRLCVQPKLW